MIELGKVQELEVVRMTERGVYLKAKGDKNVESILLPKKQVLENINIGDAIEVFVYRDSEDRLIATINRPLITIGEIALLKVKEITKIGAFLDWGLEKDLFLPFKEQKGKINIGNKYLVALYIDKSNRLCATMKIYNYLSNSSPYSENDKVKGIIYEISSDIGVLVAVDNKYHGLIPKHDMNDNYQIGKEYELRITKVREDGKLNLSLKEKAYLQMDADSKILLEKLKNNLGVLLLNDKSDKELIKKELNMSKRAFKRAIGHLLKLNLIKQTDNGIVIINKKEA